MVLEILLAVQFAWNISGDACIEASRLAQGGRTVRFELHYVPTVGLTTKIDACPQFPRIVHFADRAEYLAFLSYTRRIPHVPLKVETAARLDAFDHRENAVVLADVRIVRAEVEPLD